MTMSRHFNHTTSDAADCSVEHTDETSARGGNGAIAAAKSGQKRVLVFCAGSFPSKVQPVHGVFVKERVRFVAQLPGVDIRVISPTPYFPPIRAFKRWYPWSQVPKHEIVDGLEVIRPRYLFVPRIGGYVHPRLMLPPARRHIERLRHDFDFALIDAHFVYPSGVAAVRLGKLLGKPVVITGRGEDILRFPSLPLIGAQIRYALREATQLVALSHEIADAMERQGAHPNKITVIPNGVDTDKFCPIPRVQARRELGLPTGRPIVVSVGYRIERKGFHLLVDAIPKIRQRFPDVLVAIVGGEARWERDFLPVIQRRIQAHDVEKHVLIAGARPQQELAKWYSAADVFALLTSREGSPNVLVEALACGLPAVATAVGGIPDSLASSELGVLLEERSANAGAKGIIAALSQDWQREGIRRFAEQQSWHKTAEQVDAVFQRAITQFHRSR